MSRTILLAALLLAAPVGVASAVFASAPGALDTDVLVVGGGTGGIGAALQSARLGARTIVAEPTPWLGGMLSAAGVSATDGNHRLPSGIWREFRQRIYDALRRPRRRRHRLGQRHASSSRTWPIASSRRWRRPKALSASSCGTASWTSSSRPAASAGRCWRTLATGGRVEVRARVVVDATDLGDVLARAGAAFDLGLEADAVSGENAGIPVSSDVVQDLTWCAILKDYGPGADRTIPRPEGYVPAEFDCSSTSYCRDATREKPTVDARKMLDYARLPGGKYLINWPNYGNDTYLDVVGQDDAAREKALEVAKARTLRFVYFIQAELGFENLGLADDEYPTKDRLPFVPYHREGRRLRGIVRFTARDIADPFGARDPLYRTGISVGDYPIDHHHKRNPAAPQHLLVRPGAVVLRSARRAHSGEGGRPRRGRQGDLRQQRGQRHHAAAAGRPPDGTGRRGARGARGPAGARAEVGARPRRAARAPGRRGVPPPVPRRALVPPAVRPHPEGRRDRDPEGPGPFPPLGQPDVVLPGLPDRRGDPRRRDSRSSSPSIVSPADGRPLTVGEAVAMVTDYRAALLTKDKTRFAALEARASRSGPELWTALGLGDYAPERVVTRAEVAALVDEVLDPFNLEGVDHRGRIVP